MFHSVWQDYIAWLQSWLTVSTLFYRVFPVADPERLGGVDAGGT